MREGAVTLGFLLVYLGLQVLMSAWVSRSVRSEDDFLVAGRRISTPLLAVSMFATWFGAETCLGSSGAVYASGLSGARADPIGYSLCLALMGLLLAARLWKGGFVTLGDVYRRRYGGLVERLAVLVLVPSSVIWAAAEVRAFGQVVSATMEVDVTFAIYCSALFVIAYTFLGGLAGDVLTDFLQGMIVALGLVMLLAVGVNEKGGPSAAAALIEPSRLTLLVEGENPWQQVDRWVVPVVGSLVGQELIARVLASKSARSAQTASYLACALYLVVGASPVLLGLLGPHLIADLAEPEQLLPTLAARLFPDFWYGLFSCALLSAILSTINSVLLACAGLLSHNVINPVFKVTEDGKRLRTARWLVVLVGALALWIALYADGVYQLVEMASSFGTSGIVVTTLAALFSPWGGKWSAIAALLLGLVTMPLADALELPAPFLTSLGAAAAGYGVVAWRAPRPRELGAVEQLELGVTDPGS